MIFYLDKNTEITTELISGLLKEHTTSDRFSKQQELRDAYLGKYPILNVTRDKYKPNNRIVANFAKYITDTFCGFFDGKPLSVSSQDDKVAEAIDNFNEVNSTESLDFEIIKNAAIFGNCFELLYQDEEGNTRAALVDPLQAFLVYDDTVSQSSLFGVCYRINKDNELTGEVYSREAVYKFTGENTEVSTFTEITPNKYKSVPLIEYRFNAERQGIFENVLSEINGYNKAISEKANDVDYFGDSYLKILNVDLGDMSDEESVNQALERLMKTMRENRIFYAASNYDENAKEPTIDFIQKPEADDTQENLLNRLKDDIFHLSMVANISDETFGNASGVALQYKLLSMRNLAKNVERNIVKSLKRRYKIVFSLPTNLPQSLANEWRTLEFNFYENLPINPLEIAQTLNSLGVQLSEESALKLAQVDNPEEELERLEKERESTKIYKEDKFIVGDVESEQKELEVLDR